MDLGDTVRNLAVREMEISVVSPEPPEPLGEEMVAQTEIRSTRTLADGSTAPFFYVYSRDARALRQLVSRAAQICQDRGSHDLLVDLIGAHQCFEPTYLDMGFQQVAEHAIYEKRIACSEEAQ